MKNGLFSYKALLMLLLLVESIRHRLLDCTYCSIKDYLAGLETIILIKMPLQQLYTLLMLHKGGAKAVLGEDAPFLIFLNF